MSELISRQDAIDAIEKLDIPEDMCVFEILSHIELAIGTLPSAERKGTWIYHIEPLAFRPYGHYTCNLCNEIEWDKSNFCPNCGADMRSK